jgi:hypothetical protein
MDPLDSQLRFALGADQLKSAASCRRARVVVRVIASALGGMIAQSVR